MNRGCFIALEGGEGTGKSTQARLLAEKIGDSGREVVLTREPGGTPGAEAIRALLLDPAGEGWGARAEALLFAAARSDHVERLIRPALERGAWVVCDRFVDSSRAYQGGAGAVGDLDIQALHAIGSDGLRPDLTILVDVDATLIAERLAQRDGGASDAIGGRSSEYHSRVAEAFRKLAEEGQDNFVVIDGDGPVEQVQAKVWAAVEPMLERQS
ncbi:MAG: dTMP kinase [Erythrobacter sp.]|nr:dTMP kinase [Erythrobacter sp.]